MSYRQNQKFGQKSKLWLKIKILGKHPIFGLMPEIK